MKIVSQRALVVTAVLAVSLHGLAVPPADDLAVRGRQVFESLCVPCHGPNGEGVDGKCEDPLVGKRSLESLAGRIHRTMPEDDPDLCLDEDAEAVARYIYDAFYSLEAQARAQTPRIELVRLTNRQYLNTVADLLKHFTGPGERGGDKRGLNATYYKHRHFRAEAKVEQKMEAPIDFEFTEPSPHAQHITTNGFSAQWRGSVIADETGDYEFVLKTPNGARLWVNDQETELIDAGVASGADTERKATIRLIGGRAYPLRLDFFKYKEKGASISLKWKPPHGVLEPIPGRCLSPAQPTSTLVVATPFPADDSSMGYERGISVSKAWDEATTRAAIEVAGWVADHLDRLSRSKPGDGDRGKKVQRFCEKLVARAFRRPLTSAQTESHVTRVLRSTPSETEAVKRVVLLALKSPQFLYLGLDAADANDFVVAERLSFALWDSLPDAALWQEAEKGRLHTREQVRRQAARMGRDERTRSKMLDFLHHWLQVDRVVDLSKDPELYPEFSPEIIAALRTSLDLFLEDALWNGASDYRTLLLSDHLFVNRQLAGFYGFEGVDTEGFTRVKAAGDRRVGVLTHPYLLAAFSYPKLTSPIHRGVFLTRNIVGRSLKPPPKAVAFKDAEFDPDLTMRQKVEELTRPQACQSCHSVINPLGFSLEGYDAVGRLRTTDNGRPVDTISDYLADSGETVRLTSARDVAEYAVTSRLAHEVFIEQLFHQVVKQPILAYGPEAMSHLHESFEASGFNIQRLLEEIATLSALHSMPLQTASQ